MAGCADDSNCSDDYNAAGGTLFSDYSNFSGFEGGVSGLTCVDCSDFSAHPYFSGISLFSYYLFIPILTI